MSNVVEERIVQMEFDNTDFEQNIKQSQKSLNLFQTGLSALTGAAAGIGAFAYQLKGLTFDPMNAGLQIGIGKMAQFAAVFTGVSNIADEVYRRVTQMVSQLSTLQMADQGFKKYEEKTSSVQTIMAAVRKEGETEEEAMERVNNQMAKLNWFTDETSYRFTDMVNNIGKFTSQGMELDKSVTAMQGIATWAAKSGAGVEGASRAMYNLSQALGMGAVKLQDWKSIENANMATKEFKEQAMEAAKAAGTLIEKEGKLFAGDKEVNVQTFSQTLSEGWFSSDVLMNVLQKYGEYADLVHDLQKEGELASETMERLAAEGKNAGYELGESAFKAAQEAKTFTEAIDATKDAMSTSFLNIFETIFGNYLEAKVLWTDFAELLYDVFVTPLERFQMFADKWKELKGTERVFESLVDISDTFLDLLGQIRDVWDSFMKNQSYDLIEALIVKISQFAAGFKNTVASIKSNEKVWNNLRKFFHGIHDTVELLKYALVTLNKKVLQPIFVTLKKDGVESLSDILGGIGTFLIKLSDLIRGSNTVNKILDYTSEVIGRLLAAMKEIFDVFKKAFDYIFSGKELQKGINKYEEFLSPLETIKDVLKTVIDFVANAFKVAIPVTAAFFGWLKKIGAQLVSFAQKLWPNIKKVIGNAIEMSKKLGQNLIEFFNKSEFKNPFVAMKDWFKGLIDKFKDFLAGFKKTEDALGQASDDAINKPNFFEILAYGIGRGIEFIARILEEHGDAILTIRQILFGDRGIDEVIMNIAQAIVNLAGSALIMASVASVFFGARGLISQAKEKMFGKEGLFTSMVEFFTQKLPKVIHPVDNIFEHINGSINVFMDRIKTDVMGTFKKMSTQKFVLEFIKQFSTALLKLAAAMLIISLIPADKLGWSFGVLAGSIVVLSAAIISINKALKESDAGEGDAKKGGGTAASMAALSGFLISISAAVLVLTGALALISTIGDWKQALQGLAGIAGILGGLVGIAYSLQGVDGKQLILTAVSMLIISKAVKNIAKAIKMVGKLDSENAFATIGILALIIGGLAVLAGLAATFKADKNNIAGFLLIDTMLLSISGAVTLLGGVIIAMSKLTNPKEALKTVGILGSLMLELGAFVTAMAAVSKLVKDAKQYAAMLIMAKIMNSFALVMIAIAAAVKIMTSGNTDMDGVSKAVGSLALIMAAMTSIILSAALLGGKGVGGMFAIAGAFTLMATGLLALVPVLKVLQTMSFEQISMGLLGLFGSLALLLGAGMLMSLEKTGMLATNLIKFAAAIAILGASALMAGTGIWLTADAVEKLINALIRLSELSSTGFDNFKKMMSHIVDGLPRVFEAIGEGIGNLFIAIFGNKALIAKGILNALSAFASAISSAFPQIKETFSIVMENLLEFLKGFIPKVNSFLFDAVTDLNNYLLEILNRDVPRLNDHLAMATWDLFLRILALLNKGVPLLNEELAKEGMNLIMWVNELLKFLAATILQGTIDILTMVRDNIGEIIALTVEIANTALFGIIEGMIVSVPLLYDKCLELLDTLLELLDKILDSEEWSKIEEKINKLLRKVVEVASKWIQMECKVNGLVYECGSNLVKGLLKGIAGSFAKAYGAESVGSPLWLVSKVVNGFKKGFKINSPSKVMEELGKYLPEGLANGIEKGADGVKTAVTDIKNIVTGDFTKNFGSIGDMFSNLGSGMLDGLKSTWSGFDFGSLLGNFTNLNPTITPTLDLSTLQSQAGGISDLFANQQVSAISASGFATPDIGADSVTATNKMQEMMDKMTSYMSVQQYNASQAPNLNVTLDGDVKKFLKVAKVENIKQIKATGVEAI